MATMRGRVVSSVASRSVPEPICTVQTRPAIIIRVVVERRGAVCVATLADWYSSVAGERVSPSWMVTSSSGALTPPTRRIRSFTRNGA